MPAMKGSKQRGKAKKKFKRIGPTIIAPGLPLDVDWLTWPNEIKRGPGLRKSEEYLERIKRFEHGPHPIVDGLLKILSILEALEEFLSARDVPQEVTQGLRQLNKVAIDLREDLRVLRNLAARTAVRHKAAVSRRRDAGVDRRKAVASAAARLASQYSPRELTRAVSEYTGFRPNRVRTILQEEGYVPRRSEKKKHPIVSVLCRPSFRKCSERPR